jgi:putative membrane protein
VFQPLNIGRRLLVFMLLATLYEVGVMLVVNQVESASWPEGNEITAVLGILLGMLLVFRTHATYDRWWEGRKLWGQLTNDIRNLALKTRAHAAIDDAERRSFARLLAAFPYALQLRLRDDPDKQMPAEFGSFDTTFPHLPGYIAEQVHAKLNDWNRQGKLRDTIWPLDHHARALMDICGGCERIHTTPLVPSLSALSRYGVLLYVLAGPWAIEFDLGWSGLPAIWIATGFFIGMELAAEAIEDPFGRDGDDLPLERYCDAMAAFVRATLDDPTFKWAPVESTHLSPPNDTSVIGNRRIEYQ